MVDRDESNSRMKDFFDVYQLFTNHEIDKELLAEAIVGTFKNRNTPYRENLALFTDKFATDATRNIWWKAFLKKNTLERADRLFCCDEVHQREPTGILEQRNVRMIAKGHI